jgi:hypothetical protein
MVKKRTECVRRSRGKSVTQAGFRIRRNKRSSAFGMDRFDYPMAAVIAQYQRHHTFEIVL